MPRRRSRLRTLGRAVLVGLLLLALAPALPIAALRIVNPLGSALMVERWLEARAAGRSFRVRQDWVPLSRVSPALQRAVITAEDQRFHTHHGFDLVSLRDAVRDWRRGKPLRGASTISQQVAKNLFLWPGRSLVRKGLEAWLTLWLELLWSKPRILEVYLNVVELGDGVFGVEAASRRYFGRSAASLAAGEAALLAAVLPSPRRSSVARPSRSLRERQRWILAQIAPRPPEPPRAEPPAAPEPAPPMPATPERVPAETWPVETQWVEAPAAEPLPAEPPAPPADLPEPESP